MKYILLTIIFTFTLSSAYAKNADDLYRDGKFAEAEKAYQQGDLDQSEGSPLALQQGMRSVPE